MKVFVLILLLAAWEDCLAVQTTDRLRPLSRWLHKRDASNNPGADNRFDRTRGQSYSQTYLTLRPSINQQSAEADTRGGTAKVTVVNSTGPIQPSKTYTYPFGRERTLYVDGLPEKNSQTWLSGSGSSADSRAQRLVSFDGSSSPARRQSFNQQEDLAYEEEIRKREEDREQREELQRRQQELLQERLKQREEEEALRREEAEQRRQNEQEKRRRHEAERRRRLELRRIEEERRKQTRGSENVDRESRQNNEERRRIEEERRRRKDEEEQRRIEDERRKQTRGSDNINTESRQVYEERRRIEEERRRQEEEIRRRYQEQQRRRQQSSTQTTTQNYGYLTQRPFSGETWQRNGSSGGSGGTFYPGTQNLPSGSAQGWDQQTGYRYGNPRVVVSGPRGGFGTQYENSQINDNEEDSSECPDVGVEMRINGLDCQNAIRTFGSHLCYSHEFTSKQCCQICKQLKQTSKVGCEYGDHVDNCKILTPSDCYDLRNRYSCCATCERFKKPYAPAGCEYGDNVDRCDSVHQNPGLCYVPNNHRSCCETCSQIKNTNNPSCAYGDYIPSLCQTYDSSVSGAGVNCYSPHRRKLCCQTCERIREWASVGMPADCQYGDRPISFYYPQYGKLTCSTMFQFIDVSECRTNPLVATNCCYTCNKYITNRG